MSEKDKMRCREKCLSVQNQQEITKKNNHSRSMTKKDLPINNAKKSEHTKSNLDLTSP